MDEPQHGKQYEHSQDTLETEAGEETATLRKEEPLQGSVRGRGTATQGVRNEWRGFLSRRWHQSAHTGAAPTVLHACKDSKNVSWCTTGFKIKIKLIQRSETVETQSQEKEAFAESSGARNSTPMVEGELCKFHKPSKARWRQDRQRERSKGRGWSRAVTQAKQACQQNPLL